MPQDQSSPQQPSAPGASAEPEANSFTGIIVRAGDQYVLKTATKTYQLDDQKKAKQFAGKQVKVSGDLDKATSTIKVADILPASQS